MKFMNLQKDKIDEKKYRLEKLAQIIKAGIDPYPAKSKRLYAIDQLIKNTNRLIKQKKTVAIAGRIRSLRLHGGSAFAHLADGYGQFQIYFKKDELGDEQFNQAVDFLDVADFIEVSGRVFKTHRGEATVLVKTWRLLAKSLEPLPEKWHGLQDIEIRFRKRYLDLIVNKEVEKNFQIRSAAIKSIREFLDKNNYLEVETPILQPLAGGATARPFITHHNALDVDLYLRVAPELYLKRLVVGGFERVYELGRCFRNEGVDWGHNPEFTMLEFYQAYMDYEQMMSFTEDLILHILKNVKGENKLKYNEHEIKFKKPFTRLSFRQALIDYIKVDIEDYPDQKSIYKKARELKLEDIKQSDGRGRICDQLYKEYVRPKIIEPTFLIDHPIELSPLAKQKKDDPRYVERFQLLLGGGIELVNAFSELNDPQEQRKRFLAQQKLRQAGDEEAQPLDEDYIQALNHGLPPTAGFGMGIDRLVSLLADKKNIKEVILFPTLKPINRLE